MALDNVFISSPHRRYNPLAGEWVLVSPHRLQRPWQGKREKPVADARPSYDPGCYLCPGNERSGAARNPQYASVFVFENDYPALLPSHHSSRMDEQALFRAETESGVCKVVCFSPRHDLTLPELPTHELRVVVDMWTEQYLELSSQPGIGHVQIFENKGALMGCSNPHPHGQIWATESLPVEPAKEAVTQQEYLQRENMCLLCAYAEAEVLHAERVVCANASWLVVVPFWAKWPFETLLISRRHVAHLGELQDEERDELAEILKRLTTRYDNVFETSFPYSMGFHQLPVANTAGGQHWHLHAHFYPPLLRSAEVQKFMVGFEMLGTPQRDITPEHAAERLRQVSEVHYKNQ
ncbi:MAG: UDP-glucose--hexose-1-phosphate uridylyltransferase [Candidatus Sumerlaeaceae bacterium]